MINETEYMERCLFLAKLGMGKTAPNPMVGSVIVYNGQVIGEGYHKKYGDFHAEVNAINSVEDQSLLPESTLYVNLEPCAHHGKTPPCADLIIDKKIKRVVIGCVDSYAEVAGKGIERMRKNGIIVDVGILEKESRELNARFFTFHEQKRPYIILKWAQTLDGFIDISDSQKKDSKGLWITNNLCKKHVHKWRTQEQAILVGTKTALKDNPQLTVREWEGRNPIRLVLDKSLRLPENLHLFDNTVETYVFTEQPKDGLPNLSFIKVNFNNLWKEVFDFLYSKNIQSVIVEGGAEVLRSLIEAELWDEARVFVGNKYFFDGVAAPKLPVAHYKKESILEDDLYHFKAKK